MYILLSGIPPFNGANDNDIIAAVKKGKFHFKYKEFDNISDKAKDLIRAMLTKNPVQRITAEKALKHSWFGNNV